MRKLFARIRRRMLRKEIAEIQYMVKIGIYKECLRLKLPTDTFESLLFEQTRLFTNYKKNKEIQDELSVRLIDSKSAE